MFLWSAIFLTLTGCEPDPDPVATPHATRPNILIIDIDSLRTDRITIDKDGQTRAPHIMGLASKGVRFSKVSVPSGWTLPSLLTLLAGRIPPNTLMATGTPDWTPDITGQLMPSVLAAHGYTTGAGWGNTTLSSHNKRHAWLGGDQSEDLVDIDTYTHQVAQGLQEPFFHLLHDMDLHTTPAKRAPVNPALSKSRAKEAEEAHIQRLRTTYDATLSRYDAKVGTLLEAYETAGLMDRTIIVVVSNHGEELGDRNAGISGHSHILFDTVTTVPLVIYAPNLRQPGQIVDSHVLLQDVAPTLLELVDIPMVHEMTGISLVRSFGPEALPLPPRNAHTMTFRRALAMRGTRYKYILHPVLCSKEEQQTVPPLQGPVCERVFNLETDPGELNDLSQRKPTLTKRLREEALQWATLQSKSAAPSHTEAFKKELQKRGYWQPSTTETTKTSADPTQILRVDSLSVEVAHWVLPKFSESNAPPKDSTISCRIKFINDVRGQPQEVSPVKCDPRYSDAVLEAAKQWRFKPWHVDGEAVPFMVVREIRVSSSN